MDILSHDGESFVAPKSLLKQTWGGYGRAIFGSLALVLVALCILFVSLLAVSDPARAATVVPSLMPTATPAAVVRHEYPLPYPGVLPDSSLYRLKAMRDRVNLMLTFDSLKKAKKELLFADKRINAAEVLVNGGKEDLGVSTATKAEKYLEQAAARVISEQKAGKDVKTFLLVLRDAATKHNEILSMLEVTVSAENKTILATTAKTTRMVREQVEQAIRE